MCKIGIFYSLAQQEKYFVTDRQTDKFFDTTNEYFCMVRILYFSEDFYIIILRCSINRLKLLAANGDTFSS